MTMMTMTMRTMTTVIMTEMVGMDDNDKDSTSLCGNRFGENLKLSCTLVRAEMALVPGPANGPILSRRHRRHAADCLLPRHGKAHSGTERAAPPETDPSTIESSYSNA
eukprot:2823501-Rhodomonas_salina.1